VVKLAPIFDSLWFNVVLTIISVVALVIHSWELVTQGSSGLTIIRSIIWALLTFYFIRKTYICFGARET
jgi:hypothetical protein